MKDFEFKIINGEILPAEKATIPLNDLGLLRSFAVFDFFRVLQNVPIFLDDHAERIVRSARSMGIDLLWNKEQIKSMCRSLIDANKPGDAGLRILVTGGFSTDGYSPSDPNIYMMLHQLPQYPESYYSDGAKLITSEYRRDSPDIKTTIYVQSIKEAKRIKDAGAQEILYHWDGIVSECSRSNIFLVDSNNKVITPDRGILWGVTRKHVIELARKEYEFEQRAVTLEELFTAKETFITSSTKGLMPVTRIDEYTIGDGKVGPVSRDLGARFNALVASIIAEG